MCVFHIMCDVLFVLLDWYVCVVFVCVCCVDMCVCVERVCCQAVCCVILVCVCCVGLCVLCGYVRVCGKSGLPRQCVVTYWYVCVLFVCACCVCVCACV